MSRMTHEEAGYRVAEDLFKRCALCSMFRDGTKPECKIVKSPIRPPMVCNFFEKRVKPN